MQTIRVGHCRLYNARGSSLVNGDEVILRFPFGTIDVEAYVGANPRHKIVVLTLGHPPDKEVPVRASRERGYEVPSPERFPADLYTELVAAESIEVDDALAAAFHARDEAARVEILRRAEVVESSHTAALDYVAGVLGLYVHKFLVSTPITNQSFAYRDKGAPYALRTSISIDVVKPHDWDVSDLG